MGTFIRDSSQEKNDIHSHFIYRDYPKLHNHDYWEFFVVVEGAYNHTLNGEVNVMNVNSACLLRPQVDYHGIKNIPSTKSSHLNILIRDHFMHSVCDMLDSNLYNELLSNNAPYSLVLREDQVNRIFNYITELKIDSIYEQKRGLNSKLLVVYIIEKILQQHNNDEFPEWLSNLLAEINSHTHLDWQIQDLLDYTHYNHSYFTRQFKQYMKCTPVQYLTQVKMVEAQNLLLYSNKSITEIYLELGYNNLSHFNHVFKKFYLIPPSQYRKRHQTKH